MKSLYIKLYLILSILLVITSQVYADGRRIGAGLSWTGSQGTVDFQHAIVPGTHGWPSAPNSHLLESINGEYKIRLGWNDIWLEWKTDNNETNKILYALVDFPPSTTSRFNIDVSINENNQIIIKPDNAVNYVNGIFSLIDVNVKAYLSEWLNQSSIIFNDHLENGSMLNNNPLLSNKSELKSLSGKYTLVFEDIGWLHFNPLLQDQDNLLRKMNIWLETKLDNSKTQRILYSSISYDYRDGAVDRGTYHVDLPIQINITDSGLLEVFSSAKVTYPSGQLLLN